MRKQLIRVSLLLLTFLLAKNVIFQSLVRYSPIAERTPKALGSAVFKARCNEWLTNHPEASLEEMIRFADGFTRSTLKFTFEKCSTDPAVLAKLPAGKRVSNCIGYAALCNTILLYLLQQRNWNGKVSVHHKVAQLYLAGINLNRLFSDPFFADHDYNEIIDSSNHTVYRLDPSLYDCLCVGPKFKNNPPQQ
ncbi:MAG: hypothetical protein IPL65_01450 [Lewinellaceae bacterium]|nr:hypothetical protein [Lewinellaceae bacterium]